MSVDEVDLLGLWHLRKTRHSHERPQDKDDHLCARIDDDITYLEVEVPHTAVGCRVIAEGILSLGDADGES